MDCRSNWCKGRFGASSLCYLDELPYDERIVLGINYAIQVIINYSDQSHGTHLSASITSSSYLMFISRLYSQPSWRLLPSSSLVSRLWPCTALHRIIRLIHQWIDVQTTLNHSSLRRVNRNTKKRSSTMHATRHRILAFDSSSKAGFLSFGIVQSVLLPSLQRRRPADSSHPSHRSLPYWCIERLGHLPP